MQVEVDKSQLWKRIEWGRKVYPSADHLTIGTDVEEVVVQTGESPSFHSAKVLADVVEDGAVNVKLSDLKELYGLKGSTLQMTVDNNYRQVTFETDEGSLTVPCERTMLRIMPKTTTLGDVSLKLLRASLSALKESVGKKSEKGTESLLDASARISASSMSILSSNRLSAWTAILPIDASEEFEPVAAQLQVANWNATATILSEKATLIRTPNAYGVMDTMTTSLFPIEKVNDADKLNDVFVMMREEYGYCEPLSFEKKKMVDIMTSINRAKAFAKVELGDSGKIKVTSYHHDNEEENTRAVSFSIDYTGDASLESFIVSPSNLLKTLKGIQTKNVNLYLLEDNKYPVGIADDGSDVTSESLGLTMTINQPQG